MKLTLDKILLVVTLAAVALLADAWRSARHDSQQLATTLAAQNTVIQQAGDREKQRDSQLAAVLATIQSQKRAVQTPQQAAQQLTSVLPLLPLPVSVHDPDLSAPLPPGETPSASISIPQPDLVPLYDDLQDCRAYADQTDSLKKKSVGRKSALRGSPTRARRRSRCRARRSTLCALEESRKMVCHRSRHRRCRCRRHPSLADFSRDHT